MELLTLKTFLAVVDEGGMQQAAVKLHTVQSNVTTRIKKLEQSLDTRLFYREGKTLTLTPPGRALLDYARQMLRLELQAVNVVVHAGNSLGDIRLGTMEAFASFKLPQVLGSVRDQYPNIRLQIETDTSAALVRQVLDHRLDAAFVGGTVNHPDLVAREVVREELVLVRSAAVAEPQQALILFKQGCAYRASALSWAREQGYQDFALMQLNTLDGILGCVAIGLGITLMPRSLIANSVHSDKLSCQSLPAHIAGVPTQLVQHRNSPTLPLVDTLAAKVTRQFSGKPD